MAYLKQKHLVALPQVIVGFYELSQQDSPLISVGTVIPQPEIKILLVASHSRHNKGIGFAVEPIITLLTRREQARRAFEPSTEILSAVCDMWLQRPLSPSLCPKQCSQRTGMAKFRSTATKTR